MAMDLQNAKERARRLSSQFTAGQKTTIALAVVGLAVGGFLFFRWASQPKYAPLFSNLDSADAGAITQKLTDKKVPYQLTDGGKTILVPQNDVYQLRVDMGGEGLPASSGSGYSLLDKQSITSSEFRQRLDYQRAMEGELANTIGAIDGVDAATVHLVIPQDDVFSEDTRKASASVLVKTSPGKTVSSGKVQAVVHLVASSVEGLDPAEVTVADAKGQVLNAGDGSAVAADIQSSEAKNFEQELSSSVEDMLTQLVGPGHAVVRVNATLDFDNKTTKSETFDTTTAAPVVTDNTTAETYTGTGAAPSGVLGSTGAPAGAAGATNYQKNQSDKAYAVGRVTSTIDAAPGAVKRLSVAVLLDGTSEAEVDQGAVERLVSAAVGLDVRRGDTIVVDRMAFDQTQEKTAKKEMAAAESAAKQTELFGMIRTGVLVLVLAALAFFVWRYVRKAGPRRIPLAIPGGFDALPPGALEALPPGAATIPLAAQAPAAPDPRAKEHQRMQNEIGELIERQPEEVAHLLRTWMGDRRK